MANAVQHPQVIEELYGKPITVMITIIIMIYLAITWIELVTGVKHDKQYLPCVFAQ